MSRQTTPPSQARSAAAQPAGGAAATPGAGRKVVRQQLTMQQLLKPFDTPITPIELTESYGISVFVVAITMILLPLTYVCIIALVALAVLYHMFVNVSLLSENVVGWLIYWFPVVFGGVFVLFMIKPLFAAPGERPTRCSLDPQQEPVLFAFIERLCQALGAPVPKRIDVDSEPNASASLRRGFLSMFSDDLVLTIGLPLVAGMNLRQLTGVLAHEFGHFTQGSAMRFGYVINSVNAWFARVVYERDSWDEQLVRWSEIIPIRLGGIFLLALRLFVWLTRRLLWGMMYLAHMISCFMSRQMEFDADRHETRISGSDNFANSSMDLHLLGIAWSMAHDDLDRSWMENRLGDDLPALVVENVQQLRKQSTAMSKIKKAVLEEKTGWFDTHPSTADRIRMAQQEYTSGIFTIEAPARLLFRDFTALCKAVTLEYYREHLDHPIDARNLVPTASLVAEQTETSEAHKTLYRYFQGKVLGSHEVFLPAAAMTAPAAPRQTVFDMRDARARMLAGLQRTTEAVRQFDEADERLRELSTAWVALEAGFSFNPERFKLRSSAPAVVQEARQHAERERARSLEKLETLVVDARGRMVAALQLLWVPQVAERIGGNVREMQQRSKVLLTTLGVLERAWPNVLKLREVNNVLYMLLHLLSEGNEENAALIGQIQRLAQVAAETAGDIRVALHQTPYPFTHALGQISIADYALQRVPHHEEVGDLVSGANEMLEKLVSLYFRAMAHLAVTAEKVERVFGLPALPEPPEEEEVDEEAERKALGIQ